MTTDARSIGAGAAAGLVGGALFGMMMTAMGMMEMVAGLVESSSVAVGWLVHLVISAIFGAVYALVLGRPTTSYGRGVGLGLAYGLVVWVVGPLLVMPLWMGMPPFVIEQPQLMSMMGHAVFGLAVGLAYRALEAGVLTTDAEQVRS